MALRLTILGSGTSHGIPMIGCDCAVCRSTDPRDQRSRTSALFSYDGHHLLIDTSPELRLQCVACDVRQVDAILFTHGHADHVMGLDDVRRFNWLQGGVLSVYGDANTLALLRRMFDYAFQEDPEYPSAKPMLRTVEISGPFELFGRQIIPIPYLHGSLPVLGYRIGDIAYCPDCSHIPEESRRLLTGLEVLVLDGLRRRPHPTHFNLERAIAEAHRIGARQTYFTHITHELGHAATESELPVGMALAYDSLVCEVS
ncbi:MAG: MBL fold metallo-hydrolase [Planctomycetota bacterium]